MTPSTRWLFAFSLMLIGGCGRCNYDVIAGDGDAAIDSDADPTADAPDAAAACRFRSLAPGRDHTCVANAVGDVYCWGRNGYGVVTPDSTNGVYPTPRKIELPAAAVEVASGNLTSCARAEDGRVWCWGAGDGGAGAPLSGVVAVEVGGPASSLAVGRYYSCAIVGPDDHVACWGTNNHGQLGDTSLDPRPVPGAVPGTTGSTAIWLGHKHACARGASGDITCWGWNVTGQLGRPGSGGDELPAVIPALAGTDQLALGGRFSCGVDDGALRCWGANDRSQLAAAGGPQSSPGPVIATGVQRVIAMARSACLLDIDGGVACWGLARQGQLGTGALAPRAAPQAVVGLDRVVALAAGAHHACAEQDGEVLCWGANGAGELGRGVRSIRTVPTQVAAPRVFSRIAVGGETVCAVEAGGALWCWGDNDQGQVGTGTSDGQAMPVRIVESGVVDVALGERHGCARDGAGVLCWGENREWQVGTEGETRIPPTRISTSTSVGSLSLGYWHTCAIFDGVPRCWGSNDDGQLGDGTTTPRPQAIAPSGLSAARTIASGLFHTCAIDLDRRLWCWGANDRGQLGDGTRDRRIAPVNVGAGRNYVALAAGGRHTCAIDDADTILCWGAGDTGQLAIDASEALTPTPITLLPAGMGRPVELSARHDGMCVRFADGRGLCWGSGEAGTLGNGTEFGGAVPQPFGALTSVSAFAGSRRVQCALSTGGALWCAGDGGRGVFADAPGFVPAPALVPCQ